MKKVNLQSRFEVCEATNLGRFVVMTSYKATSMSTQRRRHRNVCENNRRGTRHKASLARALHKHDKTESLIKSQNHHHCFGYVLTHPTVVIIPPSGNTSADLNPVRTGLNVDLALLLVQLT